MRGLAIVVVSVLTGCGPSGGEATLTPMPLPPGTFVRIAFDNADSPHVAMTSGLFKWNGAAWDQLTFDGIATGVDPQIAFDRSGGALALGAGYLYRRPAGSTQWQTLNADPAPRLFSLPIDTSDGTLYAFDRENVQTALAQLYFKRASDTSWTPTGVSGRPGTPCLADDEGNLWMAHTDSGGDFDAQVLRIHETQSELRPIAWPAGVTPTSMYLTRIRGSKIYGQTFSYVANYGAVYTFDTRSGAVATVTNGEHCDDSGTAAICYADSGLFITGIAVSPSGTAYEIAASQNGAIGDLFKLDGDTWRPIVVNVDGGSGVAIDHHGGVYLTGAGNAVGGGGGLSRVDD